MTMLCSCSDHHSDKIERSYSGAENTSSSCYAENIYYKGNIFGGSALNVNEDYIYCSSSEAFTLSSFFLSINKNEAQEYVIDKKDSSISTCKPDNNGCYIISYTASGKSELSFADFDGKISKTADCPRGYKIFVSNDSVFVLSENDSEEMILSVYDKDLKFKTDHNIQQLLCNENEKALEVAVDSSNNYYALTAYNINEEKMSYDLKIKSYNVSTNTVSDFTKLETTDFNELRISDNNLLINYSSDDSTFSTVTYNISDGKRYNETDLITASGYYENEYYIDNKVYTSDSTCIFSADDDSDILNISDSKENTVITCYKDYTLLEFDKVDHNGNVIESHEKIITSPYLRITEQMTEYDNKIVWYAYDENDYSKYLIIYDSEDDSICTNQTDHDIKDMLMTDNENLLIVEDTKDISSSSSLLSYNISSDTAKAISTDNDIRYLSVCSNKNNETMLLGTDNTNYYISYYNDGNISSSEIIKDLRYEENEDNVSICTGKNETGFYIITDEYVYCSDNNKLEKTADLGDINSICDSKAVFPVSDSIFYVLGMDYYDYRTGAYKIITGSDDTRQIIKIAADESAESEIQSIISRYNNENQTLAVFTEINDLNNTYPDVYFHDFDTDISKYTENNMLADLKNSDFLNGSEYIFPHDNDPLYSYIISYHLISEQTNDEKISLSQDEAMENIILNNIPKYIDLKNSTANFSCDDFYSKLKQLKDNKDMSVFYKYYSADDIIEDFDNISKSKNILKPDYEVSVFNTADKKVISDFLSYFTENFSSDQDSYEIHTHQIDGIPNSLSYYEQLLEDGKISKKSHDDIIELLKNAYVVTKTNAEFKNIVSTETENYLSGNSNEQDTANIINNRINLYFKERK